MIAAQEKAIAAEERVIAAEERVARLAERLLELGGEPGFGVAVCVGCCQVKN